MNTNAEYSALLHSLSTNGPEAPETIQALADLNAANAIAREQDVFGIPSVDVTMVNGLPFVPSSITPERSAEIMANAARANKANAARANKR